MGKFYVYAYYEVDYSNPIYIGKGKDNRIWEHFYLSRFIKNNYFYNKLRSMLFNDTLILVKKLFENLEEDIANELEILLIKKYGRRDIGTGCLCNQSNGGDRGPDCTDKILTTVHCLNIAEANTRKKYSNESKARMKKISIERRAYPVESFDLITKSTIKKYQSICDAAKDGYNQGNISYCLRGLRKSCGKVGWRHS